MTNTDANSQNVDNANHIFIAKYDSSGNALWAKDAGGQKNDLPNEIKPDNAGNIYVTGQFVNPITFGSTTLIPSSNGSGPCRLNSCRWSVLPNAVCGPYGLLRYSKPGGYDKTSLHPA